MDLPKRKSIRLPEYDYSSPGGYFVTICTHGRRCILSRIAVGEGLVPPAVVLSPVGECVKEQILALSKRYPTVRIDNYVIMPNHIHLLLTFRVDSGGASPSPTLFDVVCVLKSLSTRLSREQLGTLPLWQRSYHEHVIRNERDYREILEYIENNPARWADDRYYAESFRIRIHNSELRIPGRMTACPAGVYPPLPTIIHEPPGCCSVLGAAARGFSAPLHYLEAF